MDFTRGSVDARGRATSGTVAFAAGSLCAVALAILAAGALVAAVGAVTLEAIDS